MRKTVKYKGFYLSICETEKECIGTIYNPKFKAEYNFYQKVHYEFLESTVLERMKREVDKFISRKRKGYLNVIDIAQKSLAYLESSIRE